MKIYLKNVSSISGASASTLQDIKVAESCNGYTYRESGVPNSYTRNRFVYWYLSIFVHVHVDFIKIKHTFLIMLLAKPAKNESHPF